MVSSSVEEREQTIFTVHVWHQNLCLRWEFHRNNRGPVRWPLEGPDVGVTPGATTLYQNGTVAKTTRWGWRCGLCHITRSSFPAHPVGVFPPGTGVEFISPWTFLHSYLPAPPERCFYVSQHSFCPWHWLCYYITPLLLLCWPPFFLWRTTFVVPVFRSMLPSAH